jgi:hypothetical protein
MMRRQPTLMTVSMPQCRNCGRYWRPPAGVVADVAYCARCTEDRHAMATASLGLRPIEKSDLAGSYLLPRRLRSS